MNKRREPRTDQELMQAFEELFAEILPEMPDEVDATLREAGYDPDEVAVNMQDFATRIWNTSPLNWRNHAHQEIAQELSRLENFTTSPHATRSEIIATIQQLLTQIGGKQNLPAGIHFRNFEQASDDDLVSLLQELEYLATHRNEE